MLHGVRGTRVTRRCTGGARARTWIARAGDGSPESNECLWRPVLSRCALVGGRNPPVPFISDAQEAVSRGRPPSRAIPRGRPPSRGLTWPRGHSRRREHRRPRDQGPGTRDPGPGTGGPSPKTPRDTSAGPTPMSTGPQRSSTPGVPVCGGTRHVPCDLPHNTRNMSHAGAAAPVASAVHAPPVAADEPPAWVKVTACFWRRVFKTRHSAGNGSGHEDGGGRLWLH